MRKWVCSSIAAAAMAVAIGAFSTVGAQQAGNERAMVFHTPFDAGVDCQGNGASSGVPGGFVNAHVNLKRGRTMVILHARGLQPDSTYRSHVRCVGFIGNFTTDADGNADVTFTIGGALTGTFAIDGHTVPLTPTADVFVTEPIDVQ